MQTAHWAMQLGLKLNDAGELIPMLDPAESRARSRRAREKLAVFVPEPTPAPKPEEPEDADDSSIRSIPCHT
jgi:hypothetical protein